MKLIEQSSVVWGETPCDKEESILWIERAGRVCYRSEDNIVEGSGIKFVENIIKRKHYSVIEHSNVVVRSIEKTRFPVCTLISMKKHFDSPYFRFAIEGDRVYIAGNWRSWIEWASENDFTVAFDKFPECLFDNDSVVELVTDNDLIPAPIKATTVEFTTDRAVTHEMVRHRPASYSQESQRYVRYGAVNFVKPQWYDSASHYLQNIFTDACLNAEEMYGMLLKNMKAEDARVVLPNATATKIVMTAFNMEWEHIFGLRTAKTAYSQYRNLISPVKERFVAEGWI